MKRTIYMIEFNYKLSKDGPFILSAWDSYKAALAELDSVLQVYKHADAKIVATVFIDNGTITAV